VAFNLTRAAGSLASVFHAKATTATIRAQLISVPGRIATSARRQTLHLPRDWPWEQAWQNLATGALGPTRLHGRLTIRPNGHDQGRRGTAGQTGESLLPTEGQPRRRGRQRLSRIKPVDPG